MIFHSGNSVETRDGAKTSEASKCFGTALDLEMPWVPEGNRNSFLGEFHRAHDRFRPKDANASYYIIIYLISARI